MEIEALEENGIDRTFFTLSSYLAEPLCWTYGILRYHLVAPLQPHLFNNAEIKAVEIAKRALIAISAIAALSFFTFPILFTAVALGCTSKVFRALGCFFQKNGYTYIRGEAPEKQIENSQVKVLTWNICGISGGMHFDRGGVLSWRDRVDEIAQRILGDPSHPPDVIVLQEVYDTALTEALIERLKAHYAHFFTHIGPNVWGSESGEMVIANCPVHRFSSTPFENNSWTLNRTFTVLDIKPSSEEPLACARIIGTHLIHGDHGKQMGQVTQIVGSVAKETLAIPTLLAGDLNLERNDPAQGGLLSHYLTHAYQGEEPTCTNKLTRQWTQSPETSPEETIDYLSLFKRHLPEGQILPVIDEGVQIRDTHLLKAFDECYNTKTALSDHHGVIGIFDWQRSHF